MIRVDYRFSAIKSRRVDVGIALGVYLLKVDSSVGINDTPIAAGVSQTAPLPLVGIDIEWDFAKHFVFKGGGQLLKLKIGDTTKIDGKWSEYRARIE